jgi:hypothetical protein
LGELNRCEVALGIEVVVARFVNDANLTVFRGFRVRKNPIDLSAFQGDPVAFVIEADDELL